MNRQIWILALLVVAASLSVWPGWGETPAKSYAARGVVEKISLMHRSVRIHHQAIPGYMMEMTMDFTVKNTNELAGLSPRDEVAFNLVVQGDDDWIQDVHRVGHTVVPAREPGPKTATSIRSLSVGDELPDDMLVAETGQHIRFSRFQGQAVAFTFFFTRCPLPDFCPRMNRNFVEARQLILSTANAPTNWEFISISFDPGFDTSPVLTSYSSLYRGENASHWLFASAPSAALADLAPRLNLMVMHEGNSISHNLRTVVLDPQRCIFRQFDGNEWTPRQLADAVLEAARLPASPGQIQK